MKVGDNSYGILTDLTRCIGCEACVAACREINGLPDEAPVDELSEVSWTALERKGGVNIRRQCMHCIEPTCASVCPVAALQKTEAGPVIYDESRCIGCRYCIMACPFEIPRYEWDSAAPRVQKCIMCYDKCVSEGEAPACTQVCPTGATTFGRRRDLIAEAEKRIREKPDQYVDHIYGQYEAGGTSVLYLSDVPFEDLGFNVVHAGVSYPQLTWNVLSQIPTIASVAGVMMGGIWWITRRRMEMERAHAEGRKEIE